MSRMSWILVVGSPLVWIQMNGPATLEGLVGGDGRTGVGTMD